MHSCLSRICSSTQTSSSNGAVGKCSLNELLTSTHASVRKWSMVNWCDVGIQVMAYWQWNICFQGVELLVLLLEGGLCHSLDLVGPDWRRNLLSSRHGRFSDFWWVALGCSSFHSHSHNLHPIVWALLWIHHSELSQTNWRILLLADFVIVVCGLCRRKLHRLN